MPNPNGVMTGRRRPPEQKADNRQQADLRAQLHAAIDRIADHWPAIAAEADHRGWPSNLRQDELRRGGSELTSVEAAAEHQLFDRNPHTPDAGEWLAELHEMRSHIIRLDARAQLLDPPTASRLGRETSVDVCAHCKQPIGGKTKRIDGLPYCAGPAGGNWCYYDVHKARRNP